MGTKTRRACGVAALAAGIALAGAAPAAAQSGCQAVDAAQDKILTIPTHLYTSSTISSGKVTRETEIIYVGGASFVKTGGKWSRSPMSAKDMADQERENRKNSKYSCKYLRDEVVGGEAAAVYSVHTENEEIKSDGTIWLSKSKGVPLKQDLAIDTGGGGAPDHYLSRYEYANVTAPI
jgi:outer membrane lipoprotein-sorting protein